MKFKDLFSRQSTGYAKFRPTYPPELYAWLATTTAQHRLTWDCGTGNGQAAVELARHYDAVVATDPSPRQLEQAVAHPLVTYRQATAESSSLEPESVDLITVAQAYHWFKFEQFHREARRVARPKGAVLALWSYELCRITPEVDAVVDHFYRETIGRFWEPERKLVETGYRTVEVPFREREHPPFEMRADWTVDHLSGYLRTWSATQAAMRALGADPVDACEPKLRAAWGSLESRPVVWSLNLRVFDL